MLSHLSVVSLMLPVHRAEVQKECGWENGSVQWRGVYFGGDGLVPAGFVSLVVALWHQLHPPADVGGGDHGEVYEVRERL